MEQVQRSGEDNCNNGLDAILVCWTIPAICCPFLVPAKISTVGFYSNNLICLQASSWTHLGTHAKACLGKHPICNFLCRRIGTLEWWNATFVLLQCWLEKGGAYHSSLHFSWIWVPATLFGECVSFISTEYQFFIFPSTLTLMLADHP